MAIAIIITETIICIVGDNLDVLSNADNALTKLCVIIQGNNDLLL